MTLWQDQPPTTRRQARESERTEALQETAQRSRRAATVEATPAGEVPIVTTPFGVASGRADVGGPLAATPVGDAGAIQSRPHMPKYEASFDTILAVESSPVDAVTEVPDVAGLFRPEPPADAVQPVTVPVAVVLPPALFDGVAGPPAAPGERVLSRRELRAMQQAQEANANAIGHAPAVGLEPVAVPVEVTPVVITPVEVTPVDPVDETDAARQPFQPPVGHWSTAGDLDDENQTYDQVLSRSVGSSGSATTTNALILPSIPSAPDAMGPLTSTGEILITGSIDLPRSLGATGQHPDHYDSPDMDRMFDQAETELNTSDVAPVRASRAVSTHTSTRGVIAPPKRRGGRLPVVLSITAAVLALGVVALLLVGYVFKVF